MWPFKRKKRREIYTFHDGKYARKIDPLFVWHRLWNEKPDVDLQSDIKDASSNLIDRMSPGESDRAFFRVVEHVAWAFRVKLVDKDGEGLTANEVYGLFVDFIEYMEGLKKKRENLPTPSPISDGPPPPKEDPSDILKEWGFGSTGGESNSDEPTKPEKQSMQHSET